METQVTTLVLASLLVGLFGFTLLINAAIGLIVRGCGRVLVAGWTRWRGAWSPPRPSVTPVRVPTRHEGGGMHRPQRVLAR